MTIGDWIAIVAISITLLSAAGGGLAFLWNIHRRVDLTQANIDKHEAECTQLRAAEKSAQLEFRRLMDERMATEKSAREDFRRQMDERHTENRDRLDSIDGKIDRFDSKLDRLFESRNGSSR